MALLRWRESRFTRDVELVLLTGFGREDDFIAPLIEAGYMGRIPDAQAFARRNRVLLVTAPNGVPVDISLAALPFEELTVARATPFEFVPVCRLKTCSVEDLIVLKMFAFRPRDLADVESVASQMSRSLDWAYIETNLRPLAEAKDAPEIISALAEIRSRSGG
jgi:hypothetical protein